MQRKKSKVKGNVKENQMNKRRKNKERKKWYKDKIDKKGK